MKVPVPAAAVTSRLTPAVRKFPTTRQAAALMLAPAFGWLSLRTARGAT